MSVTAFSHREESGSEVKDFISLLKPRVMSLVVFTGIVGLLLAPGSIHPVIGFVAIFCISLGAGAAGAINMWYERDVDALMKRTKTRPLPMGKIDPENALAFGVFMSLMSVVLMAIGVNLTAAFWLLFSIFFYVVIYTVALKRYTAQNIVIGGAAGALPPVIGWAAVTGDTTLLPWLMFGIIFLWTPPHFWALSLFCAQDYKDAGIPMMPSVKGTRHTKIQIVAYTVVLSIVACMPTYLGLMGLLYGISAALLSVIFLILSLRLLKGDDPKHEKRLFAYSIFYLFVLFSAMLLDKFVPIG